LSCSSCTATFNCHGCAHEWADACDEDNLHLPANKPECEDCSRNPKPQRQPTTDRYITPADLVAKI
jgi:hypothetical protein